MPESEADLTWIPFDLSLPSPTGGTTKAGEDLLVAISMLYAYNDSSFPVCEIFRLLFALISFKTLSDGSDGDQSERLKEEKSNKFDRLVYAHHSYWKMHGEIWVCVFPFLQEAIIETRYW